MLFELEAIGGPLARRLARRRGEAIDWALLASFRGTPVGEHARMVWTQSAFSEYASAASFAAITSGLLGAGAPLDLVAAAGDFVVDELVSLDAMLARSKALAPALAIETRGLPLGVAS